MTLVEQVAKAVATQLGSEFHQDTGAVVYRQHEHCAHAAIAAVFDWLAAEHANDKADKLLVSSWLAAKRKEALGETP